MSLATTQNQTSISGESCASLCYTISGPKITHNQIKTLITPVGKGTVKQRFNVRNNSENKLIDKEYVLEAVC